MPEILILTAYYRPEAIASSYLDDNRDEAFVRNGFDVRSEERRVGKECAI